MADVIELMKWRTHGNHFWNNCADYNAIYRSNKSLKEQVPK